MIVDASKNGKCVQWDEIRRYANGSFESIPVITNSQVESGSVCERIAHQDRVVALR